jgi:hypothetical protein
MPASTTSSSAALQGGMTGDIVRSPSGTAASEKLSGKGSIDSRLARLFRGLIRRKLTVPSPLFRLPRSNLNQSR